MTWCCLETKGNIKVLERGRNPVLCTYLFASNYTSFTIIAIVSTMQHVTRTRIKHLLTFVNVHVSSQLLFLYHWETVIVTSNILNWLFLHFLFTF